MNNLTPEQELHALYGPEMQTYLKLLKIIQDESQRPFMEIEEHEEKKKGQKS